MTGKGMGGAVIGLGVLMALWGVTKGPLEFGILGIFFVVVGVLSFLVGKGAVA